MKIFHSITLFESKLYTTITSNCAPNVFGLIRHAAMPIKTAVIPQNTKPHSIDPIPHT